MRRVVLCAIIFFFGFFTQRAEAYIDPGSGSAIMSAVVGFLVAIGILLKTYWFKIKSLFTGKKVEKQPEEKK